MNCGIDKFWDFVKKDCVKCSTIDDLCSECDSDKNNNGYCTSCNGGTMVSFDKKSCIPKIKNCADSPLGEQPNGLSIKNNRYVCGECFEGFYWDDEDEICNKCSIE